MLLAIRSQGHNSDERSPEHCAPATLAEHPSSNKKGSCVKLHIFLVVVLLAFSFQGVLAQEGRGGDCPVISVSSVEPALTGPPLRYKASIQGGNSLVTPKFNWTVTGGKITAGQGTSEVLVDAEGNNAITVTVEVTGYSANCQNKASYTRIVETILSYKFDEYGDLKFNEDRLRLDQFAIALHNQPGSKGYIIVYDVKDTRKAAERGERAKKYLVKERGFQEARIVVLNGGHRDTRAVELFITPLGALLPKATPK
jgi:hypothetical protein